MSRSHASSTRTSQPDSLLPNWFRASPRKRPDITCPGKTRQRSGGCRAFHGVLAWPSTRTLTGDDRTTFEDLPAPNTPRLLAFQRRIEALAADRAIQAQRLGALQVNGVLGEPHIGVTDMTRHRQHRSFTACL